MLSRLVCCGFRSLLKLSEDVWQGSCQLQGTAPAQLLLQGCWLCRGPGSAHLARPWHKPGIITDVGLSSREAGRARITHLSAIYKSECVLLLALRFHCKYIKYTVLSPIYRNERTGNCPYFQKKLFALGKSNLIYRWPVSAMAHFLLKGGIQ